MFRLAFPVLLALSLGALADRESCGVGELAVALHRANSGQNFTFGCPRTCNGISTSSPSAIDVRFDTVVHLPSQLQRARHCVQNEPCRCGLPSAWGPWEPSSINHDLLLAVWHDVLRLPTPHHGMIFLSQGEIHVPASSFTPAWFYEELAAAALRDPEIGDMLVRLAFYIFDPAGARYELCGLAPPPRSEKPSKPFPNVTLVLGLNGDTANEDGEMPPELLHDGDSKFTLRSYAGWGPCGGGTTGTPLSVDGSPVVVTIDSLSEMVDFDTYGIFPGQWFTFVGDGRIVSFTSCDASSPFDVWLQLYQQPNPGAPICWFETNSDDTTCAGVTYHPQSILFRTQAGMTYNLLVIARYGTAYLSSWSSYVYGQTTIEVGAFSVPILWTCGFTQYNDGVCNCGCGLADPDCAPGAAIGTADTSGCENYWYGNGCCDTSTGLVNTICNDCTPNDCVGGGTAPPLTYSCHGIKLYNATRGNITEPTGAYDCYVKNSDCASLIEVPGATRYAIRIRSIDVEKDYDYVHIYAGSSVVASKRLISYSGTYGIQTPLLINDTGVVIAFSSDYSYQQGGFRIEYCSDMDPSCFACTPACGNTSSCFMGTCVCNPGWAGPLCLDYSCDQATRCDQCAIHTGCSWCSADSTCYFSTDPAATISCSPSSLNVGSCPCSEYASCSTCRADSKCGYCYESGKVGCKAGDRIKPTSGSCQDWTYSNAATCPVMCQDNCNLNGVCSCSSAQCVCACYYSYAGPTCATSVINTWTVAVASAPPLCTFTLPATPDVNFQPLVGHAANVLSYLNEQWIVVAGGITDSCTGGVSTDYSQPALFYSLSLGVISNQGAPDPTGSDLLLAYLASAVVATGDPSGVAPQKLVYSGGLKPNGALSRNLHMLEMPGRWSLLCPSTTCPVEMAQGRESHQMVYHEPTDSLYIFGGKNETAPVGSLAVLSLADYSWSYPPVLGPVPRHSFSLTTVGNVIYAFGGTTCYETNSTSCLRNDLWVYNITAVQWSQAPSLGQVPPAVAGHSASYDAELGVLTVFGGYTAVNVIDNYATKTFSNAMYSYHVASGQWRYVSYSDYDDSHGVGLVPTGRAGHQMVAFKVNGVSDLFAIGGYDQYGLLGDIFEYHPTTLILSATPTDLSPQGTTNVTITGAFPTTKPSGLKCAFIPAISYTNPLPTTLYAESSIVSYSTSTIVCAAPDHPKGSVAVTLVMSATVTVPGSGLQTYVFWAGTNATGTYADCPAGSVTAAIWSWRAPAAAACTICPAGTFSTSGTATYCDTCPSGTISYGVGQTNCYSCPPGTYVPAASAGVTPSCTPCAPGYYNNAYRAEKCTICAKTGYQPSSNATSCITCPTSSTAVIQGATNVTSCECDAGSYGKAGLPCTACDVTSMYCPGATEFPIAAPGYWRPDAMSALVMECNPKAACSGGKDGEKCATGYYGRMCSLCLKGYYKLSGYCEQCPAQNNLWKLVLAGLCALFAAGALTAVARPAEKADAGGGGVDAPPTNISAPSIGVSFFQTTSIFGDFKLSWPKAVVDLFSWVSALNINIDLLSTECAIQIDVYEKWRLQMAIPWIMLAIFIAAYGVVALVVFLRKRKAGPVRPMLFLLLELFMGGYLLFLTLIYVFLSGAVLSLFACTYRGDGSFSLDMDPSKFCYDAVWKQNMGIGVGGLFLYVLGIPLGLFVLLFRLRKVHGEKNIHVPRPTNFFVNKYRNKFFYWEVSVMVRKLLIIVYAKFFSSQVVLQSTAALLTLFVALLCVAAFRPMKQGWSNMIEMMLLIANFFILFAGIIGTNREADVATRAVVSWVVIVVVAVSTLMIVVTTGKELWAKGKEKYLSLRQRGKKVADVATVEATPRSWLSVLFPNSYEMLDESIKEMDQTEQQKILTLLGSGRTPPESATSSGQWAAPTAGLLRKQGSQTQVIEMTDVADEDLVDRRASPARGGGRGGGGRGRGRGGVPSIPKIAAARGGVPEQLDEPRQQANSKSKPGSAVDKGKPDGDRPPRSAEPGQNDKRGPRPSADPRPSAELARSQETLEPRTKLPSKGSQADLRVGDARLRGDPQLKKNESEVSIDLPNSPSRGAGRK